MKALLSRSGEGPPISVGHSRTPSPFQKNFYTSHYDFSMENFIKKQIEAIFYLNKKMDLQTKIQIYWKTTEQKTLELTSCSIVYSIIRDAIENIARKLRNLIDHSFSLLTNHSKSLCKLSQTSASWLKNWAKFKKESDPAVLLSIYPPLSNAYIMMYRHACECSRQVYNLWMIIYECITVKDLKCDSFQQNISELLLEIFTAPTTFEPKRMLPAISLVNKCKFINADNDNITKRLEYTRFQEDELAKNLMEATAAGKVKFTKEDCEHFKKHQLANLSKRLDRNKIDHTISFEEVRKQYIDTDWEGEAHPLALDDVEPVSVQVEVELSREAKGELLDTFEDSANSMYEMQDTSSQEDDLHTYSISGNSSNKDELIQESYEIEVEQFPFSDKNKYPDISAKLSSSTAIDELYDPNDLTLIKNYEFETPPDFILQEDLSGSDPEEKQPQFGFDLSEKLVSKVTRQSYRREMGKDHHVSYNLQKIKKKIAKQHGRNLKDSEDHSKYLHYQKQKLEKYRKELEKEKEDLLREVQKFVREKEKEKEKDTLLYRMVNEHQHTQKSPQLKRPPEPNKYDFNKFKQEVAEETLEHLKPFFNSKKDKKDPLTTLEDIIRNKCLPKEKSESGFSESTKEVDEIESSPKKMSKRQQKLRKKVERQMKEMKQKQVYVVEPKQEAVKGAVCDQQIQLTSFLQSLTINANNRVDWHIQEGRLERWKAKMAVIRAKSPNEFNPVSNKSQEKLVKSSKKKKKNRR